MNNIHACHSAETRERPDGRTDKQQSRYEPVIGLEIHAQLKTRSKMFSPEACGFQAGENKNIHPVSLGLPGTLPVLNRQAALYALRTAKAFSGNIQPRSLFARKHYFYPDLPKGYQISQNREPFCLGGRADYHFQGKAYSVPLERIHMEEDAGQALRRAGSSLLNFNRAGQPLLEIVTRPEIRSPAHAAACARAIRRALRYIGVCDGNLEEGSMRCDCNVSVRPKGSRELGVRAELKNLNSFRFIENALKYEISRQIRLLESGNPVTQETRLYDSSRNETRPMRSKEEAGDYRYFPDPDLPALRFKDSDLREISLPELPFARAERFQKEYGLKSEAIESLVEDPPLADYFERAAAKSGDPQAAGHWILGDIQARLKESKTLIKGCPVPPEELAELLLFVSRGEISRKMAKEVLGIMWSAPAPAAKIIEEKGFRQISDEKELEGIVEAVLKERPRQLKDYEKGRTKIFGFFAGQAMKASGGRANPQKISEILKRKLPRPKPPESKKRDKGFSLTELLTAIGIIFLIAGASFPYYSKYAGKSYEAWAKSEMAEIASLLYSAKSMDGNYHQFIHQLGYRPQGVLFGTVGIPVQASTSGSCCSRHGSGCSAGMYYNCKPSTAHCSASPKPLDCLTDSRTICEASNYSESCEIKDSAPATGSAPLSGFTAGNLESSCKARNAAADWCSCDEFTIAGLTAYGAGANPSDIKKKGFFTLNHRKVMCASKKSDKLKAD